MKIGLQRLLMLGALMICVNVHAQLNEWTWINGDTVPNAIAMHGNLQVPGVSNNPGSRHSGVTWQDVQGNLWLFGGHAFAYQQNEGAYNDLWKYNIASQMWTWMRGDSAIDGHGVYGVPGVSSPLNDPPSRAASMSWTDAAGNFWLFGGANEESFSQNYLNDLWKYNPISNQWTWMKGDSVIDVPGVYGVKGVPSAASKPGARAYSATWKDASGNLWLYGGSYFGSGDWGYHNDLWKYDVTTNMWTWVSGDSTLDARGSFGVQGVASSANNPRPREAAFSWADNIGNLWMFGGFVLASWTGQDGNIMDDLWRYNIASGQWTWVKGDSVNRVKPTYGVKGTSALSNTPGARASGSNWTDAAGNFWVFGGAFNAGIDTSYNDMWKFTPASGTWTWMNGDSSINKPGRYGVKGVSSPNNTPTSKAGTFSWSLPTGILWLFGGGRSVDSFRLFNDLWEYNTGTSVPLHLLTFTAHLNEQGTVNNEHKATVNLRWTSENELNFDRYEVERSENGRSFNKVGSVKSKIESGSRHEYSYDDLLNSQLATHHSLYYRLKMVDKDGSFTYSKVEQVTLTTHYSLFTISPNPATHTATLHAESNISHITITDVSGKVMYAADAASNNVVLNVTSMAKGIYIVKARFANGEESVVKMVKE